VEVHEISDSNPLLDRFEATFNALVKARETEPGPRIASAKLKKELERVSYTRDQDRKIWLYGKGESRPNVENAWELGEALKACGATWASGYWMLYAAGRIPEFVATTNTWIVKQPKDRNLERRVRLLWDLLNTVTSTLTEPDMAQAEIATKNLIAGSKPSVPFLKRARLDLKNANRHSDEAELAVYRRQIAVATWRKYRTLKSGAVGFDSARRAWNRAQSTKGWSVWSHAAYHIARQKTGTPVEEVENAVRILLGNALFQKLHGSNVEFSGALGYNATLDPLTTWASHKAKI
jgi:hypothetical protein